MYFLIEKWIDDSKMSMVNKSADLTWRIIIIINNYYYYQ